MGGISSPPLTALANTFPLAIEERPETLATPRTMVGLYGVTPGYFAAMGIPLERGRYVGATDVRGASMAAVISHSLAERFWPGQDPTGKRIRVEVGLENPWMTIVGIVGDVRFKGLDAPPTLAIYHAEAQQSWRPMAFAVQTAGPPSALISAVRREIAAIDREQPVYNMVPLETVLGDSIAKPRFHALLILCFAGLGASAGGGGSLRSDVILGEPTHAGDRSADGAGRESGGSNEYDSAARVVGRARRVCAGARRARLLSEG